MVMFHSYVSLPEGKSLGQNLSMIRHGPHPSHMRTPSSKVVAFLCLRRGERRRFASAKKNHGTIHGGCEVGQLGSTIPNDLP